jgi:hypothetical protein
MGDAVSLLRIAELAMHIKTIGIPPGVTHTALQHQITFLGRSEGLTRQLTAWGWTILVGVARHPGVCHTPCRQPPSWWME